MICSGRFITYGFLLHALVYGSIEKPNACTGKECEEIETVPLLDNQNAPLVAKLDLSTANEKINRFINDAITEKMSKLTETKLEKVLTFLNLEAKMEDFLNETGDNLSRVLKSDMDRLLQEYRCEITRKPSFCATLTSSRTLTRSEVVKFDNVQTNIGQGYDPNTGVFTIPQDGVYEINVSFLKTSNKEWLGIFLMKNNDVIAGGYCGKDPHSSGSINVILDLHRGDRIFVRRSPVGGSINGNHFSMFSGHLL